MKCEICQDNFLPMDYRHKICSKSCREIYKQQWYLRKQGRTQLLIRTSKERWIHTKYGYVLIKVNNELVYEHRVLAEEALGKSLPKGAVVHHTRGPANNHEPFDLVICPSQAYHVLLHKRMEELGYGQDHSN